MVRLALACLLGVTCAAVYGADDKEKLEALAKSLKSKDAKVRLKAAEDFGDLGDAAAPKAKELCEAILDPNQKVALAAFTSLEKVRPDLYKPLAKLLLDESRRVRAVGAKDLGDLGDDAKPAAAILVNVLRQSIIDMKTGDFPSDLDLAVYRSLRAIKPDDADTIKAMKLFASATNRKPRHRYYALEFLAEWAGEESDRRKEMLPLIKAGFDNDTTLIACINLAGAYGPLCKDFLPGLKKLKLSNVASVRDAATKAVEQIEEK